MNRTELANERARKKLERAGFDEEGNLLATEETDIEEVEEVVEDEVDDDSHYKQRIRELESQLAAANGRVGPTQAELDDYRRANAELRSQLSGRESTYQQEIERLRAELEDRNAQVNIEDLLDEDERDVFDPTLLKVVTKLADAVAKKRIPKVDVRAEALKLLQERDTNKVQEYRNKVLTDPTKGLHQLAQLSQDPTFQQWSSEDDNDMEGPVRMLLAATSTEEIDRYQRIISRRIDRFKAARKDQASRRQGNSADAAIRLATGMRRNPDKQMSASDMQVKLAEAKRLARSPNRADQQKARALLDSLS